MGRGLSGKTSPQRLEDSINLTTQLCQRSQSSETCTHAEQQDVTIDVGSS
jgi:hypothetical protein